MEKSGMRLKLLIDTSGKRVLFAEAGKDCVDFLFFILSLPISTIIRLLGKQGMVGALPNLYESIESLNDSYIQPNITKETLLQPVAPLPGYSVPLLSIKNAPEEKNFYKCSRLETRRQSSSYYDYDEGRATCRGGYDYVSDDPRATCPCCKYAMNSMVSYVSPPGRVVPSSGGCGFVKEVVTYMVMDDLVIKPMSAISSITLLTKFNINNVSALEEKVVNVGMNEAVELLKASLVSKKVLTEVFLKGDN